MQGSVSFVNPKNGFFIVEVGAGDYTVVEILGGYDIEIGDIIAGDLDSPGDGFLRNETQGVIMSVYVQDVHCAGPNAWAIALR